MTNYKLVPLDPTQLRAMSEAKAAVQWACPAATHLLYKMLNPDDVESVLYFTRDIETLATDGSRVLANPEYFFGLTLPQKVFAITHEVWHAMFHHCSTGYKCAVAGTISNGTKNLPYDPMQGNIAMDYIINDMNVQSHIGQIKKGWLHDTKIATYNDSFVDVYFKNYKKNPPPPPAGAQFDQHLPPGATAGQDPASQQAQPNPQAWQQAIAGAKAVAEAYGKLPGPLAEVFNDFLEPVVDWTDQIKGIFARRIGSGSYDFRKPDRRLIVRDIIAPGRAGFGAGTIVLAIDTSGSIYAVPKLIERFMSEMGGIIEDVRPRKVIVLWIDTEVRRADWITDAADVANVRKLEVPGGGGTAFEPAFDWVEEEGIEDVDAFVYLTDGFGSFPNKAPRYPVIWGSISDEGQVAYPFGDVIQIPNDGTA